MAQPVDSLLPPVEITEIDIGEITREGWQAKLARLESKVDRCRKIKPSSPSSELTLLSDIEKVKFKLEMLKTAICSSTRFAENADLNEKIIALQKKHNETLQKIVHPDRFTKIDGARKDLKMLAAFLIGGAILGLLSIVGACFLGNPNFFHNYRRIS